MPLLIKRQQGKVLLCRFLSRRIPTKSVRLLEVKLQFLGTYHYFHRLQIQVNLIQEVIIIT